MWNEYIYESRVFLRRQGVDVALQWHTAIYFTLTNYLFIIFSVVRNIFIVLILLAI